MPKAKTTNGHSGAETAALREQVEQLTAAIEKMAKAEGAEAVKARREGAISGAGTGGSAGR